MTNYERDEEKPTPRSDHSWGQNHPHHSQGSGSSNQYRSPYGNNPSPYNPSPGYGPSPQGVGPTSGAGPTGGGMPPAGPGPRAPMGPTGVPPGSSTQPKQKRTVGLGTALGLMLVGAVLAGGITGLVVGNTVGGDSSASPSGTGSGPGEGAVNDGPDNALNEPAADAPPAPEGSVEHVADAVLPAVVSIQVSTGTMMGEGSGSIISEDGYVLTNHHVVDGSQDGGDIQVTLNDGTRMAADFVASDAATDIGVIKIRDASGLPTIRFGDSEQLNVGQQVVAIGAPLGLSGTVTSGIVSALDRPVRASQGGGESSLIDAIQTDAPINPGNSGGPLVDMDGNLIGMNSVIATSSSESGSIGLGFAIPSNFANRVATQLIEEGAAYHPMLGVTVDGRDPIAGALIDEVIPGGPGDVAGLQAGDVVIRLDDRLIDTADALVAAVRSQDFGDQVTLEVLDPESGEIRSVEVTLSSE